MNPLGESLMNDPFLATPEPMPMPIGERKDIDQALSLLQLSGGSGSQVCRRVDQGKRGQAFSGSSIFRRVGLLVSLMWYQYVRSRLARVTDVVSGCQG